MRSRDEITWPRHYTNLKQVGIIIAKAKSQFCQAGIKILGYICDADSRHPNTSNILKILDWLEYTDASSACAFIGVCVYYQIWIKNFV